MNIGELTDRLADAADRYSKNCRGATVRQRGPSRLALAQDLRVIANEANHIDDSAKTGDDYGVALALYACLKKRVDEHQTNEIRSLGLPRTI